MCSMITLVGVESTLGVIRDNSADEELEVRARVKTGIKKIKARDSTNGSHRPISRIITITDPNNVTVRGTIPVEKAYLDEEARPEEVVIDRFGNTAVSQLNIDTHAKVILSKDTIAQVLDYARHRMEDTSISMTLAGETFDSIILSLLNEVKKKQRKKHYL